MCPPTHPALSPSPDESVCAPAHLIGREGGQGLPQRQRSKTLRGLAGTHGSRPTMPAGLAAQCWGHLRSEVEPYLGTYAVRG